MLNILDNAAKYSYDNSEIIVKVGQNALKNAVFINVSDKGVSISKDDLPKIFEKFSRIDSPLTRKIQGSGLGLYITKNLVEKMNGEIRVLTDEDETIFEISFPVADFGEPSLQKIKE